MNHKKNLDKDCRNPILELVLHWQVLYTQVEKRPKSAPHPHRMGEVGGSAFSFRGVFESSNCHQPVAVGVYSQSDRLDDGFNLIRN